MINFEFNKDIWFASAFYNQKTHAITINPRTIFECKTISDGEKNIVLTWQIEHEVLHAVIQKLEGIHACDTFDNMAWALQDKKEFLELEHITRKIGWIYHARCKYLNGEENGKK